MRQSGRISLPQVVGVAFVAVVVAAILFPVFSRAKMGGGPRSGCAGRLSAVGHALLQYVADNEGRVPSSTFASEESSWAHLAFHAGAKPDYFKCPQDKTQLPDPFRWPQGSDNAPTHVISYGMNSNLGGNAFGAESTLSEPTKTVLLFEVADAVALLTRQESDADSPTGNAGTHRVANIPGGHPGQTFPDGLNPDTHVLHVSYATGDVGGRKLNGGLGSSPRHLDSAEYLMADGRMGRYKPAQVSGGIEAVDPGCDQGTKAGQAPPCDLQTAERSAGTGSTRFAATFSPR